MKFISQLNESDMLKLVIEQLGKKEHFQCVNYYTRASKNNHAYGNLPRAFLEYDRSANTLIRIWREREEGRGKKEKERKK